MSVAAGDWHSLAVTSAGKVLAWGDNIFGQLGYPTTAGTATSGTPSFTQSGGGGDLSGIRAVAGGMAHSVALTSGGAVLSWGDDHYGQLGLGSSTGWTQTPRPASLPANTLIGSVAAGGRSTLAVTSAGNVLAWGDNVFDQLGYPTTPISDFLNYSPTPTQVPGLSSISTVSMGQVHALAVTGGLAAARTYRADASAVYVENLVLNGMRVPDGGAGLCEAGPVTTHVDESHAGVGACSGLASMLTQLGVGISVSTAPAQLVAEAVDVHGTAAPADATVTAESSTALLQVELPGGIPVVARDLRAVTRGSCLSPESGVSSVGRLEVANTAVATQPVGSRIVFNPSAGGQGNIAHVSLHGNPIAFNPTGGRVPAAIVTLNYSRHDPSTNTETTSPAVIEFPARGPFAAAIAGRIFLSYTTVGLTGCTH